MYLIGRGLPVEEFRLRVGLVVVNIFGSHVSNGRHAPRDTTVVIVNFEVETSEIETFLDVW